MPNYLRMRVPGGTYFFTVVTFDRRPLFADPAAREMLGAAMRKVRAAFPFRTVAAVLLPDHLHAIWTLPPRDADYSVRWKRIKEEFTEAFLAAGGEEGPRSPSRVRHGERSIWQRRFWEHTVRDDDDLIRCVDYSHWNPVKHGLAARAVDWPHSTFARFVAAGDYPPAWGETNPVPDYDDPEWE